MNRDELIGTWHQFKGKAKTVWADLTDDDILRADGNIEILIGTIQQKFGETKQSIIDKIRAVDLS